MRRICFFLAAVFSVCGELALNAQSVTGFTPVYGAPGSVVDIYGSGFTGQSIAVFFNGVQAPPSATAAVADSIIQTEVPSGATTGLIRVELGSVNYFTSSNFVVLGSGPYVTGFSPTSGGAGTVVTINGAQFTGLTSITFNGTNATQLAGALSDTLIAVYAPANVTTGPITVTTANGSFTTSSNFFVAPSITSFSPDVGRAGTNVVIIGNNLTGTTSVTFNGLAAPLFTLNSATQLTATVPTGVSSGPITVFGSGGATQTLTNFVVLPTVTGFSPPGGPHGSLVTINGLNFGTAAPTVNFTGASAFVLSNSDTQIFVFVPNASISGPVTVTNSVGGSVSPVPFYLPPTLDDDLPQGGPAGTTVTINGLNLLGVTAVTFGGIPASFTVVTNTQITAVAPNGVTTGIIVATDPGGGSTDNLYFYAPPIITSFSPNAGGGGTVVHIFGTNFLGTTSVTMGGINATISSSTNGQVTVTAPVGVVSGPITVNTLGGSATTSTPFYGPPSISGVLPAAAPVGAMVTVSGLNFLGATNVLFGAIPASWSYISNTKLSATVPSGFTSGSIIVMTPGGTANGPVFSVQEAELTIRLVASGLLRVSWPSAYSDWVLQTSGGLPAGSWSNVVASPMVTGTETVVTNSVSGGAGYYRLSH